MAFEELPHTADIALRVRATDRIGLWISAADAMTRVMAEPMAEPTVSRHLVVTGADDIELMHSWLSALLGWAEVDGVAWARFDVHESPGRLEADVEGVPLERCEAVGPPIKAVTYHRLAVYRTPAGWTAEIVFDV